MAVDEMAARVARVAFLIAVQSVTASEETFKAFISRYGRDYDSGTYRERFRLFESRAEEVHRLNANPKRRWTAGLGPLADYTDEELAELRGWRGTATAEGPQAAQAALVQVNSLPEQFLNWTTLSSLQNVFDQGSCGSCWAVTSAVVLMAHAEIYQSPQRSFSVQELVDCVPNPNACGGTGGCSGATVELAMNYAMHLGLREETQNPYRRRTGRCGLSGGSGGSLSAFQADGHREDLGEEAVDIVNQTAAQNYEDLAALKYLHEHQDMSSVGAHLAAKDSLGLQSGLRGWQRLPVNSYEPLLRAVYERGPVGVSVAARTWHLYSTGVFDYCDQDAVIDHAVTLIGFGRDEMISEKFWLIQNSWGHRWGEGGRIRLLRDEEQRCGWDRQAQKGTACKGDPSRVRVCGMCGILYDSVVPHFAA